MKNILLLIMIVLLGSCSPAHFMVLNETNINNAKNLNPRLKKVQVYNSEVIILERYLSRYDTTEVTEGLVINRGNRKICQVIIEKHQLGEIFPGSSKNRKKVGYDQDASLFLFYDYDYETESFNLSVTDDVDQNGNKAARVKYGKHMFWVESRIPGTYENPALHDQYGNIIREPELVWGGSFLLYKEKNVYKETVERTKATGRKVK